MAQSRRSRRSVVLPSIGPGSNLPVGSRLRWECHWITVLSEYENVEQVVDETHESPNSKQYQQPLAEGVSTEVGWKSYGIHDFGFYPTS